MNKQVFTQRDFSSTLFQRIQNTYYYIERSEKVSWFGAAQACHRLGAHLIRLESAENYDAVVQNLQDTNHYWTDTNNLVSNESFNSLTTGNKAVYFNWHKDEPNTKSNLNRCVELNRDNGDTHMRVTRCDTLNNFICQL